MYAYRKKWVNRVYSSPREKRKTALNDRLHSDRSAAAMRENKAKLAVSFITITIIKVCESLQISHSSASTLVQSLGYSNECAKWVQRMLLPKFFWSCTTCICTFTRKIIRGKKRIKKKISTWIRNQPRTFYDAGIDAFIQRLNAIHEKGVGYTDDYTWFSESLVSSSLCILYFYY